MITVGIAGASGYSGEVLVEILAGHPRVKNLVLASHSHAGRPVEGVLPRLAPEVAGRRFIGIEAEELASTGADVWFLALPHGVSAGFAAKLQGRVRVVFDLSADFRLRSPERYATYYGAPHPLPDWLARVPYVLPEFPPEDWQDADLVACPGCYPTSILLPLLPLVAEGLSDGQGLVVSALSGVSGAGKKESLFYSFTERMESAGAYGLGGHRHLAEIEEQLERVAGCPVTVQFTPHLVPMVRGIATTITLPYSGTVESVYQAWEKYYSGRPGIRLLPSGRPPETRPLWGRNRLDMSAFADSRTGNLVITSAIDNLMKGASGQAVQLMNLYHGWPETEGLR